MQRPNVTIQSAAGESTSVPLPEVFLSPIRSDIVHFVHTNLSKNSRQAHGVKPTAGHEHSAESWGTGRAVSRIPRVRGGGTHRASQGAFGNMCRKGRMFSPIKIWRRWHRIVNKNQRRYAVASALAASAVPALVQARGHRIEKVQEIPLVISNNDLNNITKTKQAVALLKTFNAYEDVEKAKKSRHIRAGKGKARNRRYVQRKGPLVVYNNETALVKALRNTGVELSNVHRLNLLQLAPGGHLGRFIIWTQDAFEALDQVFGTAASPSTEKKNYRPPRGIVTNADISRIVNSDEVKAYLRPKIAQTKFTPRKRNPLRNKHALAKLNPYALKTRSVKQERTAPTKKSIRQTLKKLHAEKPESLAYRNLILGKQ